MEMLLSTIFMILICRTINGYIVVNEGIVEIIDDYNCTVNNNGKVETFSEAGVLPGLHFGILEFKCLKSEGILLSKLLCKPYLYCNYNDMIDGCQNFWFPLLFGYAISFNLSSIIIYIFRRYVYKFTIYLTELLFYTISKCRDKAELKKFEKMKMRLIHENIKPRFKEPLNKSKTYLEKINNKRCNQLNVMQEKWKYDKMEIISERKSNISKGSTSLPSLTQAGVLMLAMSSANLVGKAEACNTTLFIVESGRICDSTLCDDTDDILEKLLTDAASITFVEEFQSKDDHRWGNLIVVNHMGRAFSAREHLLSAKLALEFPKFQGIALKLKTINIQPQLSNSGKLTMRTNTSKENMANFFSTQRSRRGADDFAKNKVEEWRVRNKHENNIIDAMSKTSIGEKKHVISTGNKESMQFTQQLSNNGELTKGTSTISVSSIDLFPSLSPRRPVGNFGKDKVEDWRVRNKCESNIVSAISKSSSVEVKTQAISTDNNESMQSAEQSTNMSYIGSSINNQDKEEDMPANFMSTINTNKLNPVKMENMSISPGSSIGFPCFKKMSQEDSNKNFSSPYDELTIIPAGFDVTRLNTYRNEETHWHRKKTTRRNNQ